MSYLAQPTSKTDYGVVKVGNFINVDQFGSISVPGIIAGPGITVDYAAESITISSLGADLISTVEATGNYTVSINDEYIGVNSTTDCTITLPAGVDGRVYTIKNELDNNTGKIKIESGIAELIDGKTTYEIKLPYQSVNLVFRGSQWRII